jgi:hypothetical protein
MCIKRFSIYLPLLISVGRDRRITPEVEGTKSRRLFPLALIIRQLSGEKLHPVPLAPGSRRSWAGML